MTVVDIAVHDLPWTRLIRRPPDAINTKGRRVWSPRRYLSSGRGNVLTEIDESVLCLFICLSLLFFFCIHMCVNISCFQSVSYTLSIFDFFSNLILSLLHPIFLSFFLPFIPSPFSYLSLLHPPFQLLISLLSNLSCSLFLSPSHPFPSPSLYLYFAVILLALHLSLTFFRS